MPSDWVAQLPRRLARLAGALAGLILLGLAVLHLPWVRGRVLDRVRYYAETQLGVAVRASHLDYNLFTRTIDLRDLSIASNSAPDPFLDAHRAVIVFGPGIFLGRLSLKQISLSRPRLTLVRYAAGTVNLPPSRNGAGQDAPLQLGILSATGLSARVDDRVAQRSLTVGPLDLSVDVGGPLNMPGVFGPGEFSTRVGEIQTSGTIVGRLAFDGRRLRVEELTAGTKEGHAVLDGWMDVVGERPAVSARIRTSIDLPQAARLAGVGPSGLAGHIDASADATGALAAPAVTLTIGSRGASYAPIGAFRLTGRSSITGNRALIDNIEMVSAAGSVEFQGAIELGDTPDGSGRQAGHVSLRWTDVLIDNLARALGQSLPVRSGSLARGSSTVEFDVRDLQAREWSRLRATAATAIAPAAMPQSGETLSLSGSAELRVGEGRWSLRHSLYAQRAQVELAGDVTGRLDESADRLRSTLGGRTRVRLSDIGLLPPFVQAAGVTLAPEATAGLAGSMLATVDLAGTVERPLARIDVEGRDLRARALSHPVALDARLAVDRNGVRAEQLQATAGTTSLRASGLYAWRGPFDARVELIDNDLSWISSRFSPPLAVSGSARIEGTISGVIAGTSRSGQAVLTLSARDLAVEEVAIGSLSARGTIPLADGALMTVDVAAPGIGARTQLQILNRAGYPVSGEIALDPEEIATLIPARYRERIGDVSGRLSATARGSGQLSDPAGIRGRIDLRALDVTVRGTRIALAAPGSVTVTEDRLEVNALGLRVGDRMRATVAGQVGVTVLPEPLRLQLDSPLSEFIEVSARAAGAERPLVRGDGSVKLDVRIDGTLGRPLPSGRVAVQSSSLEYGSLAPVTDLTVDGTVDPTLITLHSIAAQWQGASIRGDGTLPWRVVLDSVQRSGEGGARQTSRLAEWLNTLPMQPARARLTLRADNVTEAVLRDVVAHERLQDVQGLAAGTVAVEADRLSLERLQATAVLDRATLTLAGVAFNQKVPTRLHLEKGRASIADFHWIAEGNSIEATGGADLAAVAPSIDLGVAGAVDLRVLGAFVSGITSGGTAHADLKVTGPFSNPDIVGRVDVADGEVQLDRPRLAASDFDGTLHITSGRRATVSMAGLVNTGKTTVEGTLDLANLTAPLGTLQITARGVALEYPSGLQTESNVTIELALNAASSTLTGRVDVLGGTYREPIVLTTQLLNLSGSGIARATPSADWLSRTRLNITIATADDVRVENNYGRFDVGATLRLVGTAASPGVLGRLQSAEDGEIYLGGNTYRIERLSIDLTNPRSITPEVNFSAQTRVGDLPIGVELRCPAAGACERKVTSLATGVDDAEAESRLFGTSGGAASAGEGLARLLSGEILGVVGRTVGLDAIRLEQEAERRDIFDDPTLISGDVDPATRLTLARRLGSNVEIVYSQNLADDGFTWSTTYVGPFGLSWRLLLLDDESRSYEFRHEIGGRTRQPVRAPGPRISDVRIAGSPGFPENELRRQLRLTEGDRFTFGAWQRDRDRLERFYHAQGFLEVRIRARRVPIDSAPSEPGVASTPPDATVALEYALERGPASRLVIHGTSLPEAVRDRIAERWTSALFDGFLERDARTIVRDYLYRDGYLNATVTTAIERDRSGELKTLAINAVPGPIVTSRIELTGNAAVPTDQLVGLIGKSDPLSPWLDAGSVERLLENYYRSEGFLSADVSVGMPEARSDTSVVTIQVDEGASYSIGQIELSGLPPLPDQDTLDEPVLSSGDRYRPARVTEAVERIEARLRRSAYRQARAEVDTRVDATSARVDITVRVAPGPRSVLHDVVVQGGDAGKPSVARSIVLEPGAPLDSSAIRETRQRLYDLDLYKSVDIDLQPRASPDPPTPAMPPTDQPVVATITLEERPRYRFRYGLALSDETIGLDERDRRLGFAADLENRNLFGRGASAAVSVRLRRDQQVGRLSLGARRFFGLPIRSTAFVEREREQLNPDGALPITSNITAFTGEQAYRIRSSIELRYGYGIERNHTFIRDGAADPFDLKVKVARFTTSGLVDRRDDAFNPQRGSFAASTLELSRPGLGSDLRFLKNFAQYSRFDAVGRGLVLASAARLGLARTFDDEVLIPSERFYAGGGTSVRGYREDDLGARSIFDDAEGGSAMLVFNSELRFPIYRWLKGVGFVDLGNVYPTVSDISLADFQIGLGAGARFDTPFGLFRVDLGIPANRRSFDPRWRIHVGLGHAF